jgi:hypothetical protein
MGSLISVSLALRCNAPNNNFKFHERKAQNSGGIGRYSELIRENSAASTLSD